MEILDRIIRSIKDSEMGLLHLQLPLLVQRPHQALREHVSAWVVPRHDLVARTVIAVRHLEVQLGNPILFIIRQSRVNPRST